MVACRVVGCVALACDVPQYPSGVWHPGVCAIHLQMPAHDLRVLLERRGGACPPLRILTTRIEYERADGTRYGYDDSGRYYDAP